MKRSPARIDFFVYGTLKRGHSNHNAYCRGMLRARKGSVLGTLNELPSGDPVLKVDEADVLAHGTADYLGDATLQKGFAGKLPPPRAFSGDPCGPDSPGKRIHGEILTFDDPESRFPLMDELEEFRPGEPSLYLRVLLAVQTWDGSGLAAWTYVCGLLARELRPLETDIWTP